MKNYVNLTNYDVVVENYKEFRKSGAVAYLDYDYEPSEDGVCTRYINDVVGLPEPKEGVEYIVSPSVIGFVKGRSDLVTIPLEHPNTKILNNLNEGDSVVIIPFLVLVD